MVVLYVLKYSLKFSFQLLSLIISQIVTNREVCANSFNDKHYRHYRTLQINYNVQGRVFFELYSMPISELMSIEYYEVDFLANGGSIYMLMV